MFSSGFNFGSSSTLWWCLYSLGWLNWHQDWLLFSVDLLAREISPVLFCSCCCWSALHVCHLFAKLEMGGVLRWSCIIISPFSCQKLGPSLCFHIVCQEGLCYQLFLEDFLLQGCVYLVDSLCRTAKGFFLYNSFIFRLKLSHSLIMRPVYI